MKASRLIGPRRRLFQGAAAGVFLIVPFVRVGGESLLRLDLATLTLHIAGGAFGVEELYFVLILALASVLAFLAAALAFGRVWCGWACPQTLLSDAVEWFARRIGADVQGGQGSLLRRLALHLFCAALALALAATLLWYFVSPYAFFSGLTGAGLPAAAWWALGLAAALLYLDLAFVRRLACREICPYGRFQSALGDEGTLTLRVDSDAKERCIGCGSCVRACPTGIDIRRGVQIECINCGRCVDACRRVMGSKGEEGLIRYAFGTKGEGARVLLRPRLLVLSALVLILSAAFAVAAAGRQEVALSVGRPGAEPVRALAEGGSVNLYTALLVNRSAGEMTLVLEAVDVRGEALAVLPARQIHLAPRERRRLDFSVLSPPGHPAGPLKLQLRDERGRLLAQADARLIPALRNGR